MAKNNVDVPSNDKGRRPATPVAAAPVTAAPAKAQVPTAKKNFDINKFRTKIASPTIVGVKELQWIPIDDALEQATGMFGVPKGYVTLFRGYSNTGKSTALMRAAVNAQKAGDFVVIVDTEGNIDKGNVRLTNMGFDWSGNYEIIRNKWIVDNFTKLYDKDRREASIEDLGKVMYYYLDLQEQGDLPFDIFFAIDSIGTLKCTQSVNALEHNDTNNNMWNAGAYEKAFMTLLNSTIPSSRSLDSPYTNTIAAVQKIWYDSMNKVVRHKGGETFFSGSRLIYHFGGILTHGTARATATSKGRDVNFGFENKVNIAKNHVDSERGGISMEGKIISTPFGFIGADKASVDAFKKQSILHFRNAFEAIGVYGVDVDNMTISGKPMDADGKVIERSYVDNLVGSDMPDDINVNEETGEIRD